MREGLTGLAPVAELEPPAGLRPPSGGARLQRGRLPACGTPANLTDAPGFYLRDGGPYADDAQRPYPDNHLRFALLGWAAAALAHGLDGDWQPALVHAHDWHAALAPAYLHAAAPDGRPRPSVFTVHNLAYQGLFPADAFAALGLPAAHFDMHGVEFHGQLSFMKAGLYFADRITTVSPSYAREIQSPEQGCGLDGLLRARAHALTGILNGVDETVWNPATDALIAARYEPGHLAGKTRCRTALQRELGLARTAAAPLFCVVSRLTEQKGLHLVLQALPALRARGAQFALLGSGDPALEAGFAEAAAADPEGIAVRLGYDEAFAHRLIAGSDVILVPSRFEPCGLTQLYGLKYGTLPLVRRVGGLADTVADTRLETIDTDATGFVFDSFSAEGLLTAADRAFALHARKADWKRVRQRAMERPSGWQRAADEYLALYRQLLT
jgi:starch synthase